MNECVSDGMNAETTDLTAYTSNDMRNILQALKLSQQELNSIDIGTADGVREAKEYMKQSRQAVTQLEQLISDTTTLENSSSNSLTIVRRLCGGNALNDAIQKRVRIFNDTEDVKVRSKSCANIESLSFYADQTKIVQMIASMCSFCARKVIGGGAITLSLYLLQRLPHSIVMQFLCTFEGQ
jgi:hypothetical protein